MKNPKSAPASVASLLGKKLNKIHVLKFNEKKSNTASQLLSASAWLVDEPEKRADRASLEVDCRSDSW